MPTPARLWRDLLNWRATIGGRVAFGWAASAIAAVAAGFVLSFLLMRDAARQRDEELLRAESRQIADSLADDLRRWAVQVRRVAQDPSVEAALLDSNGREIHVAPIMRLNSPDADAGHAAGSWTIAILDYRGRALAVGGRLPEDERIGALARSVLADGQPKAQYLADAGALLLAHPIRFPGTGNVEGAVLGRHDVAADLAAARARRQYPFVARIVPEGLPRDTASVFATERLVPGAPLDRLNLELRLSDAGDRHPGELRRLLIGHVVAGVALTALVLFAALRTARSVTRPISALAQAASERGARRRTHPLAAPPGAPAEVQALAVVLEDAFSDIERSHVRLALLEHAMNSAHDGITVVDALAPDMPAVYVNRAVELLSGYDAAELIGRNMRLLHEGEAPQKALEQVRAALRDGTDCNVVLRNRRRDGGVFMNELSISPVRDAQGRITHFIGIQSDVSERIRTGERLMTAQKMEALGRMTGGLAHDFNNLLGIVIGSLDLMAMQMPAGGRLRERLDTAMAAALRGADVTRALLAVARRQPLEQVAVDVERQLRELSPLIRNTVGATVRVREQFDGGQPTARLDPNGFDNAILNLVINARDAMPKGGTLTLGTAVVDLPAADGHALTAPDLAPGRYVRIQVGDDGAGMAPADLARAFEPFFSTKPKGKGTGLGLSTVYGFTRQLGGLTTIESAPGEGTTVSLYLPYLDERPAPDTGTGADALAPAGDQGQFVLVVDDEPPLRALTCEWLQQLGHRTAEAGTAAEAIELLGRERFDVVLTDIVMPGGMDGVALARWVQAHSPATRVLLASGYSDRLGTDSLPCPLVEKPFRKKDLVKALARPAPETLH